MGRTATAAFSILLLTGLAACGGGGGGGGLQAPGPGGDPPVGDLTVVASVVSHTGKPVPNMAVVIDGVGPRLTDAGGRVQFTQVAAPYDAIVFQATDQAAYVYEGVTRTDPRFEVLVWETDHALEVEGSVTGGTGFPMPPDHDLEVYGHFEDVGTILALGPSPVSGGFASGVVHWQGPGTTRLTLVALQYQTNVDGLAQSYTGYGLRTVTVTDGDVLTNVALIMDAVGTEQISGNASVPPEYVPIERHAFVDLTGGIRLWLPPDSPSAPTFAYRVPAIPGSTCSVVTSMMSPASIYTSAWVMGLRAPISDIALELPYATECGFPIQGAVGVGYETPFLAGPDEGDRVYTFHFQAQAGGPRIILKTASPTATIPDLTIHGLGLAPGTPCRWKVDGDGAAATLDGLLDPERVQRLGFRTGFNSTMTQWWEFTFGP